MKKQLTDHFSSYKMEFDLDQYWANTALWVYVSIDLPVYVFSHN